MPKFLKRPWQQEEGQSLSEYALLLFLISLTAVTAMAGLATRVSHVYSNASTHVNVASQQGSVSGGSLSMGAQFNTDSPPAENSNHPNPK